MTRTTWTPYPRATFRASVLRASYARGIAEARSIFGAATVAESLALARQCRWYAHGARSHGTASARAYWLGAARELRSRT